MTSVIIPAHDEALVIGRLIEKLVKSMQPGEFEIIVVANGCRDDTAARAAAVHPSVRVISLASPSKHQALTVGNQAANGFPRLYVDADVELGTADVRALAAALEKPGVMCAGPQRTYDMKGRPWRVRWYYRIWTRLPEVRTGLFGRGVVGVSAAGYERLAAMPALMADDLAASLAFRPAERLIVPGARVLIRPPRTFADLLRGRTRAIMGADQLEQSPAAVTASARTRLSDVVSIVARSPRLAPQAALFLGVGFIARRRARSMAIAGGYATWLRDESSRTGLAPPAPAGCGDAESEFAGSMQ